MFLVCFCFSVRTIQGQTQLVQTMIMIKKNLKRQSVSLGKFQLAVPDPPPPAPTGVWGGDAAQPHAGLSDFQVEGHRLPVQGLQGEGLPRDLNHRRNS